MTITVVGAGYVGLTTAALFANAGHTVNLIESHFADRLETIKSGRSWFYEAGLDPLVARAINAGLLLPTDDYACLKSTDVVFSCMGTPDNPDGSSNLTFVFNVVDEVIKTLPDDAIFIQKSTVPVGTGEEIKRAFAAANRSLAYVSNPEFLREGTAIADTLWFDRVVVGSDDVQAAETVLDLYRTLESHREDIARLADVTPYETQASLKGEYIRTGQNSAELIKVTANAFLALKISFANSIAKLADATGADIKEVMNAVGADPRIGRAFLNAGRGYGGGCFPKDVSGLIASGQSRGVEMTIMHEAATLNESMPGYIVEKLKEALGGELEGKKVAVLGLAFKAGTSDARRSTAVSIANLLTKFGAKTHAYDPEANHDAERNGLSPDVSLHESTEKAVDSADAVCIATDWEEFLAYDLGILKAHMKGNLFVDCMNVFDPERVSETGFRYIGVGRSIS